jgi:hypothetical protein
MNIQAIARALPLATFLAWGLSHAAWATTAAPEVNVPEPASLTVLAVGAGALFIARMRRK